MWMTRDFRHKQGALLLAEPGAAANAFSRWQRCAKRVLDLAVSVPMILVLLPLVGAAALMIKLDSRGPVLFVQTRVGQGGREFRLLKLRTMHVGNDDTCHRAYVADLIQGRAQIHGGLYKLTGDPRITRVGHYLRRLSIDEIPQLLCVIGGQMSMVGPRPPLPNEVSLYDTTTWQRMRVKPGLTGPWQVSGRSLLSFDEMVRLDVEYWKSWRFSRDVALIARTPAAVLSRRGAA
jgi:lipopolysaccharide/colanic/teichoic acid biosynthesis glycosyltransferase